MTYNILKDAKLIKNDTTCMHDINYGFNSTFPNNGDVDGWNIYNNIYLYGSWNKVLFGSSLGVSCYFGREINILPVVADDYYYLHMMMKLTAPIHKYKDYPTKGKIQWITNTDDTWNDDKSVEFDLEVTGNWKLYIINMAELQYWSGNIVNFRIYPFIDGYEDIQFAVKYIRVVSDNKFQCLNTNCLYYTKYSHPCPAIGRFSSITAGEGKTHYTTISGVSDTLYVNIDDYGSEKITLGNNINITGDQMAKIIGDRLSAIDVGGYTYAYSEHTEDNKLKITSGNLGIASDDETIIFDGELAIFVTAYNCLVDPSYFTSRNLNYVRVNAYLNMISGSVLDILKFLFTNEYNPSLITVSEFLINNSIFQNILDIKFSEPLTFYQMKAADWHAGNPGASLVLDSMGDIYVCGSINDFYWGSSYYPPNELKDVTNDYLLIDNPQTDMFAGEPYTGKASSTSELFLKVNYGSCRFIFATLSHQDLEIGNTGAEQQYDLIEKFDQFAGSESVGGQSGYSGFFTPFTIVIEGGSAKEELGFNEDSINVTSSKPASGFDFASSRRLKAYEINRLVDNDKKSTAYYHDPDQRVVEAGRRDYFEAVSTYNVASNNTPDFYSEINGQGYILIDLTHPVTDSGRLKHIKVNGSKYLGFDSSVIVFRPFKDGTLIKLYETSFLSELSTSIYSTVNSTHHVETDFMVSKGDLIGFKNFGILCPHSSITLKPNAMLYKLGANDNIDVRFEPGNIFCQGVIGPSYYAYSERVQDSIKLSVDFGKRINIGEINVHGKEFNDSFEYNIASCLDVSWQCNLYNESHTHRAYHDTGLYVNYWTHKNIPYGLDSLNNCKTTVDNGRQGTSFTGGNGGNGLATFGEHSYFYVNGDAEWLYGVSSSKSEFWYPWRNAVTYDYEFDPVALYIHFPHNKNINIHRSIIYFKESENFKKMFLAYYMAPAGLPGNSGQYGYNYIPNFSSVKLDGTKYTAEDVGGTKYSTADLIMPNPMPNSKMVYVDGEASDENWALYQVAGNTEWNVMEHNFEPINCYGFMVYCDWHKSTKIIEMELYSSFPVKPVLVDNIFMSSSIYGDYWDTILFKEDNKDPNKAYSNLVSSPRYFNMEFSPQSAFELYELSFEVAESDLKLLDCNNTVLMDSAPRNQMTSPKKLEIENVYDVPLKLSVSVPTKFIPNNNLLSHIKMVSQETTEYAEVGPGAVVEKNDDYNLELYNSQVAINCPSYYLKNLAVDAPIWAFEKNKYWKDLGLSGSKGEINYLNESGIFKASITFDATSSKFWKFNILTHEFHRFYTVNVLYNNEIVAIKDLYVQAQSKGLGSIKQVINTDSNGEYIPTPVIYDNFSDNDFINYWQYNIPLGNYFREINNVLKPTLLLPNTTSYFERNLQCPLNSFAFETEFYYNPIDYRNLIGYKVELLDNYDTVVMGLELNNDEEDVYINIYTSNLDKEYEPTSSYQNDHSYYSQSHKLGFIDSLGGNFRFSITKEFRDYTEIKLSALPSLSGSEYCSAKSVVFDIADNHGGSIFLSIRSIEFKFRGNLIINSNPTVYATSNISNSGYEPENVFDTDLSKIGDQDHTSWLSEIYNITNQRLIVVFDSETEFDEIVVNNGHHYGDAGGWTTSGAKNVVIHISSDIVTDTTYGAPIPNSRKIFDGVFDEHVASDIEDDQSLLGLILDLVSFDDSYVFYDGTKTDTIYLLSRVHKARISYINNSLVSLPLPDIVYDTYFAKTLIFDCENNWGRSDGMGIRMVELLDINGDTIPLIPSDYSSYDSYHYHSNTIFGTAFDTTRSKTGSLSDWRSDYNAGWVACCGGSLVSNQRGVIVFNSDIVFYGVRINNYHNGGGTTNAGVKDIKVYLSRAIIDDTTYGGSLHGTHMIFDGQIDEHVSLDIVDDQTLSGIAEYNYDQSATFFYSNSIELDALPIISQDESLIIELTGSNPANEINLIMDNTDLSDGSLYFSNTGQDDFTLWAQNIDRFSLLTEDQASVHASGWRYNFILTYYYYNAYPYWALLDDILSGYYDNQQTLWMDQRELPIWWVYDFGAGNERKVDYMYVKLGVVDPAYSTPDTLTIYGSNDASLDFISGKVIPVITTTSGNYTIHIFNSDGAITFHNDGNVDVLIVAGGGAGGGSNVGAGGGAGGLIYQTGASVSGSEDYTIVIGDGGVGGSNDGENGNNSSFGELTALGGGGGGGGGWTSVSEGFDGGSGGGANGNDDGTGTPGLALEHTNPPGYYGNDGGNGYGTAYTGRRSGGGGGGAGSAGQNAYSYNGGDGGAGVLYDISGTPTYYAGGGGGATNNSSGKGIGGIGGGGDGTNGGGIAENGVDGTGGGGGGRDESASGAAGDGGRGVVIVRYLTADFTEAPTISVVKNTAKSKDFISQHTIDMSSGQPELYINTNIINYYRHYCFVFTDTSGSTDPFSAGIHLVKFYEDLTESTSDLSTEVNYYDHYFAIDLGQRYVLDFMRNYGDDPDKIYLPDIFTGVDYSLSEEQDPNNVVWSTDDYLGGSFSARSIIFDIADNYGYSAYISIRSLEFKLDGVLIPNPVPTTYHTSYYSNYYVSYYAFDTDTSKTGSWYRTSWLSETYNITNQRLIVVFDSETEFDEIVVNNGHYSGNNTSTGAKNVVIHISSDIVTDTTYGAPIPNSRKIFDGIFDEHIASNVVDDKTVPADTRLPEEVIDYEPIPGTSFSMVGSSYYARWVKIPLLCGDGVDRLIQQLGIYPNTHYAYTKDGEKNCEWGSLGNALTGYGVTYNLAEGSTVSGVDDEDYFSDWSPYKCITGGRENYGYENCWGFNATSGSTYPSFILDLGDVYYVSKFFITHCYSDYDLTTWQNEDYNIYGKSSWNEPFTLLFSITNNSSLSREHILDEALQVRYIKLEITNYIKPAEPFRIYDVSTGDYIYFDGGFVRIFEVWSANNISLVNSEDHPVICTNLKDSYTISSHSLVTIKQTDGEEDEDIEWDNSEEFFKYSDNYSDDPSNVSFLDSSGVQTIFSDGSEFLSQSQNEDEMRIRTDLYLAPGRYSIDWESYGAVSEEAVALKFTGIDIKIIPSSNIATSWVTQSDYLSVDEDSYYTIDAICQVTDTERWGVRNIVIQQNNSNNSKWILVQRNTATDFAWNNLEDDKEIDYLNNLKVYATNTYMPTEKYWWWSSTESTLSNDVVNTKVGHASLKIEYPTSSGVDRVDFIEGDHFGWDQNWSIKDSLCFWLYISDIDKLYTEAGGFGFGSFYGGTSEMFIDDLDKQKNITPETAYYTWDFNELNLKTGWNKVRLQFDRNTLTVPLTSNTTFTLEDELNFRDNNYFTSFGIVYRGVGESFYMLLDDLKIERNWFNDDVYDNEKGLCLTWKEYAEVPVGGLNVRRGSIEFWVKLYTDMSGKDSFGRSRSRTLFTITNSNNEIISLIIKSSGWLEVGFGGARNNFNIMYADPYVYDLSTVSFIKDEPFHIAMTWSNDGSGMDNADTMRLYINNTFVISSKETWNVGDSKTSTLRFGGATTILAGNNDLEGSAIFSNIKTYDYCKNNFEINNLTSKGVEALNSNSIIQLSSDGENFYDINSGKLPIVYEEVPPGDKVDIYTRVDKTKMDLIEKQSGIIDIEWEVIV